MYTNDRYLYADVCVIGGGSAGCAAAVYAQRSGLDTILIEQQQALGGMFTCANVSGLAGVREGFAKEVEAMGEARGIVVPSSVCPVMDAEKTKYILEELVHGCGARMLYDTTVYDLVTEGGKIKEILAFCKGTRVIVRAKYFIDASGDAVAAGMAGVPVLHGNGEFFGFSSASSLHTRFIHVNWEKWTKAMEEWKNKQLADGVPENRLQPLMGKIVKEGVARGELPPMLGQYLTNTGTRPIPGADADPEHDRSLLVILHSYFARNTDPEDLTRQIVEQHYQTYLLEGFFRKYLPGWENCSIIALPSMNGLRDGVRIQGEYTFSREDMTSQRRFEDSIARFDDMFDLHHPYTPGIIMRHAVIPEMPEGKPGFYREITCGPDMHPFGRPTGFECRTDPKGWCEIPYRSIVPQGVDNLFVVGRCFSVDYETLGGARLVATCMSTGQAAGIAAKLCLEEGGIAARDLDGKKVHEYLRDVCGVPLDTVYGRLEERRNMTGEPYISPGDSIKYR